MLVFPAFVIYCLSSHSSNLWFESIRCRSFVLLGCWCSGLTVMSSARYVSAGRLPPPVDRYSGSWEPFLLILIKYTEFGQRGWSTLFKTVWYEFPLKATCGRAAWKCKISFVPLMMQIIQNTSTDLLLWYYALLRVLSMLSLVTYIIFHTIRRNTVSLTNVMVRKALFMSSLRFNKINSGLM